MHQMHALVFIMMLPCWGILFCIPIVYASLPGLNSITSISTLDTSNSPSSTNTRTLWDIIWGCTATLFACTWTAIHPNIPGIRDGKFIVACRRLFIMIVALIAPELMITWATRQFFSARSAAKDVKGWTVTHGFFVWMGGFMLYVNGKPRATLTLDELLQFVREGSVDMPVIIEAEIKDRSKGDGLSKGIAIFQLVWFVLQLAARHVQNLPMTLLEIDTLAVAALTCVPYILWWKKPKDVGRPYAVHWKAAASPPRNLTYDNTDLPSSSGDWFFYLVYPLISIMGFKSVRSPRAVRSHRVPSLGGYGKYHGEITLLVGCVSGMLFGGIHCLAWNFLFHRHGEQILWHVASLAVACAPLVIYLTFCYWSWFNDVNDCNAYFMVFAVSISAVVYVAVRVTLIALMIQSLRSLPRGVYSTVTWIKFVPHL
ncbi:hypothetical protein EDB19DRAFT_709797 [Suillus lakei]|nr:hypothetical protein EDB19DRAFT_709797 [Suillus lakei]